MSAKERAENFTRPVAIGTILHRSQSKLYKYKPVWDVWEKAVGASVASKALPEGVQRNGVLVVGVASSVWMQELQFSKHLMIENINRECKKKLIKDITFRLASSPTAEPESTSPVMKTKIPDEYRLRPHERVTLEKEASTLGDQELKKVISRILDKIGS